MFKIIAESGHESEQVDVSTLKDRYHKNKINRDTMIFDIALNREASLENTFDLSLWQSNPIETVHEETRGPFTLSYATSDQLSSIPVVVDYDAPPHPWRRYWARTIDHILYSMIIGGFVGGVVAIWPDSSSRIVMLANPIISWAIVLVLMLILEPMQLYVFGSTLGKFLLGIKVQTSSGNNLSFFDGMSRAFNVFVRGLGLFIPLISLITLIVSYNRLVSDGVTTWDKASGFVVIHKWTKWRTVFWIGLLCLSILIIIFAI